MANDRIIQVGSGGDHLRAWVDSHEKRLNQTEGTIKLLVEGHNTNTVQFRDKIKAIVDKITELEIEIEKLKPKIEIISK